jgi:hypothetical protein
MTLRVAGRTMKPTVASPFETRLAPLLRGEEQRT